MTKCMRSYVQFLCLGGERMYIDTHTKETIEASVCEYLGFTKDELKLFLIVLIIHRNLLKKK